MNCADCQTAEGVSYNIQSDRYECDSCRAKAWQHHLALDRERERVAFVKRFTKGTPLEFQS